MPFPIARRLLLRPPVASPPGILRLTRNAALASGRVVSAGLRGRRILAAQALQDLRHLICKACPGGFYQAERDRCLHKQCGCYLTLKTRLLTETCPASYWPTDLKPS